MQNSKLKNSIQNSNVFINYTNIFVFCLSTFSFLFVLLISNFYLLTSVSAHTLSTDSSIGAVLHIDPEDDPIAGEQAYFFYEIKDTQNKFKPEDCDCKVRIEKLGQTIFETDLFSGVSNPSLDNASFNYIFPEKNIYKVILDGKPKTPDAFQPFTITTDFRVERENTKPLVQPEVTTPKTGNNFELNKLAPLFIGLFILIVSSLLLMNKRRQH